MFCIGPEGSTNQAYSSDFMNIDEKSLSLSKSDPRISAGSQKRIDSKNKHEKF